MTKLTLLILVAWVPVGFVFFLLMKPRRAVLATYIGGWMFLPVASFPINHLPDYDKVLAVSVAALLGVLVFDMQRLLTLRPRWYDLPMLVWCLVPFASSLANGLGAYDGLSATFTSVVRWGIPYALGRAYFCDRRGMHDLAVGMFIGGLVYVPLCLYEIRMSPQLHNMLYGYHQTPFLHVTRFGGYRPLVFMAGGLPLSLWMATASLTGVVLWHTKALKSLWGVPTGWLVITLVVTTILCKSTGAIGLLFVGMGIYFATRMMRTRVPLIIAIAIVPAYLFLRIGVGWDGQILVDYAGEYINEARAASLETRLSNESRLIDEKIGQRPLLGWAGWGRGRITNDEGKDITITDSLWIIALQQHGLVGLVAFIAMLTLPLILLVRSIPPPAINMQALGAIVAVGMSVWVYVMDRMVNAQLNPIAIMMIGALVAIPWLEIKKALSSPAHRRTTQFNSHANEQSARLGLRS